MNKGDSLVRPRRARRDTDLAETSPRLADSRKIKSDANPFDPEHKQYFRARRVKPKGLPVTIVEKICNEITVNFSVGKRRQPGGPARLNFRNA